MTGSINASFGLGGSAIRSLSSSPKSQLIAENTDPQYGCSDLPANNPRRCNIMQDPYNPAARTFDRTMDSFARNVLHNPNGTDGVNAQINQAIDDFGSNIRYGIQSTGQSIQEGFQRVFGQTKQR